jgi:hypothetical protein
VRKSSSPILLVEAFGDPAFCEGSLLALPLLLVVDRRTADLLSVRINSARGDRAALAVGRHDNATANGGLAAIFDVETQRTVVDLS